MLERRKIKNKLEISSFIKIHSVLRKNKKNGSFMMEALPHV